MWWVGGDDARSRRRDLSSLAFDLTQPGLELVGLTECAQTERGLPAQRPEQSSVVHVQRSAALGSALEHAQLLAALAHREALPGRATADRGAGGGDHRARSDRRRLGPSQSERPA
jgi:hypothetical protein